MINYHNCYHNCDNCYNCHNYNYNCHNLYIYIDSTYKYHYLLNVLVVFEDYKMVQTKGYEKPWALKYQNDSKDIIEFYFKQKGKSFEKFQYLNTVIKNPKKGCSKMSGFDEKKRRRSLRINAKASSNDNSNDNSSSNNSNKSNKKLKKKGGKTKTKDVNNNIDKYITNKPKWVKKSKHGKWMGVPTKQINQKMYRSTVGVKMYSGEIWWTIKYTKNRAGFQEKFVGINRDKVWPKTIIKRITKDVNGIGKKNGVKNLFELIMYVYILVLMCIYIY